MNHSIHSADRSTHLNRGCRARCRYCGGWFRYRRPDQLGLRPDRYVVKAGKLTTVTSSDASVVR